MPARFQERPFVSEGRPPFSVRGFGRMQETSISRLLFQDAWVYKWKKAIELPPFIDYRSRQQRDRAVKREFDRGVRHAPDIYHSLVSLELEGELEPALKMVDMSSSGVLLSTLLRSGPLPPPLLPAMAQLVRRLLGESAIAQGTSGVSMRRRVALTLEEARLVRLRLPAPVSRWLRRLALFYDERSTRHRRQRFVGVVHGDLHAGNVFAVGSELRAFDFLDFSPNFLVADIALDIGFLLAEVAVFQPENVFVESMNHLATVAETDFQLLLGFVLLGLANRANVYATGSRDEAALSSRFVNTAASIASEWPCALQPARTAFRARR